MMIQSLNYRSFGKEEEGEGKREGEDGGDDGLRDLKVENCEQL